MIVDFLGLSLAAQTQFLSKGKPSPQGIKGMIYFSHTNDRTKQHAYRLGT